MFYFTLPSTKIPFILIVLFFISSFFSAALVTANNEEPPPTDHVLEEQSIIKLDIKTQQTSGIETIVLSPVKYHAELATYGKAISIQPLLLLRTRYLIALTERNRATAKFKQTEQNSSRQQDLYQHGVTSKRNVQDLQALWQADKAQLDATNFQEQSIIDEAILNWGKTLTEWALIAAPDKLNVFLSGEKALLLVNLPTNHQLAENNQTIYVEPSGDRSKAEKAELISAAPQTDASTQGSSYFFQTRNKSIRTGMNISAWILKTNQNLSGVIVPKSAVCWAMNQAFVYVKTGGSTFSRRAISDFSTTTDGYFINHGVNPGEQIVTIGAQMLLSEEMRKQIPDDD